MTKAPVKIEICVPCAREKFEKYIQSQGGVKVWENVNLSNPGAGNIYTPGLTRDGKEYTRPPSWTHEFHGQIIKDINAFRFVKEMREVKRFHVAIRRGSQGFCFKCTDASSAYSP